MKDTTKIFKELEKILLNFKFRVKKGIEYKPVLDNNIFWMSINSYFEYINLKNANKRERI